MGVSLQGGVLHPEKWGHVAFSVDRDGYTVLMVDGASVASGLFQGDKTI